MTENKLIEQYGNPKLVWGYYPLSAEYNSGGCTRGCGSLQPADPVSVARAQERKLGMEQRGGNNSFDFQEIPTYTQHQVGTGCYNPNCHCDNCHGDCLCDQQGSILANSGRGPIHAISKRIVSTSTNDALTWIAMIALFYFIYKLFLKRR